MPPPEKKQRSHIKAWAQSVAESVRDGISPARVPGSSGDRTLASIEFFPRRVLATFHRLGYERIGDLSSRGVKRTDYAALIRHLMTLPRETSIFGEKGSFDEIEAWVAERRLMEL